MHDMPDKWHNLLILLTLEHFFDIVILFLE